MDWLRQGLSKGSNVLRFCLCFASHPWQIALELLHHGCDLDVRTCTKHCVFSGKRRLWVGEKLAPARSALRISYRCRRFAVESSSICARTLTEGFRLLFLFFVHAVVQYGWQLTPHPITLPHRMAHSLPHNLKNLCRSQITTAHRHRSINVHIVFMNFRCGLQRSVLCFAIASVQIAGEWLRQGSSLLRLRAKY